MKRYSLIVLITLITAFRVDAQLFPVRTITNVPAPYPLSLEQYGSIDNNHITLTIIPNDIALQNYPVKLKLYISGSWFKIYTNPAFVHKNILLNNGETMTITGAELSEWFNPDNLIFEGYSKAQYLKTGRLPEGVYQIWFEAWDMYRDFNISGTTKAMVWTFENEPPILNFPENQKELEPYDPQNIVFNWTFRQSPFSMAGSSNQYRFELWEIEPDNMNAEEAVRVLRPIYTTEITASTLNYTAGEPLLFKGKKYAWRIQVFDPMNTMRYKNDGYSGVRWFRFGKDIPIPVLALDKTTITAITVKWDNDYRITKYEVRYRNKGKTGANWYTKEVTGLSATLDNLLQNTAYEIQLRGISGMQEGEYSETLTARTNQDISFACGSGTGTTTDSNSDPLPVLKKGDIFNASDFDVQVFTASGSNGTFSGHGLVMVPLLKFVKFEVEFAEIRVNSSYRMTSGEVRFIYNENNGMVINVNDLIEALTSHEPRVVEENPYAGTADKKITTSADITEVSVDANGVVTVKTSDGHTTLVRGNSGGDMVSAVSNDPEAEQYVVDTKTKTVYQGSPEIATSGKKPEQPQSTGKPLHYMVTFLPHIMENGGMDIPSETSPAANYDKTNLGGNTIQIPWKSVEKNKIDRMLAHISSEPADSVRFLTEEGNMVMTAPGDKAFINKTITIPPAGGTIKQVLVTGTEKKGDQLKAWYPEYEQINDTTIKQNRILAGQVNVVAYDKEIINICIVEVNGATVPETLPIEEELNSIYAPAIIQWKVSRIKNFNVNIEGMQNGIFDNTDPDNDMDYTDHENQVYKAFKKHDAYNHQTKYLFFIGGKTKDPNLKGFMPFNRQFGFIFRDQQQIQELIRTIAHELGHGAFRLRHPFSPECPYPQSQGQTNNLMDYVDAGKALQSVTLHKYQWDEVHDWDLGMNWFEGEEEGELIKVPELISYVRNANLNGIKDLNLMQDKCEKVAHKNVKIGAKKLSYIHIACSDIIEDNFPYEPKITKPYQWNSGSPLTSGVHFDPSEICKVEAVGINDKKQYLFYQFHELNVPEAIPALPELTDKVLFYFVVLKSESKDFEEYLFPTWEYLITLETLTPSEIAIVREGIEKLTDITKKKELYLELQTKVPYHNQRDNVSIATDEDVENNSDWLKEGQTAGEIMCNMTCFAACLEYLGKQKPCTNCTESCKDQILFPDYLECVHRDKIRPLGDENTYHRKTAKSRELLSSYFDVMQGNAGLISDKMNLKTFLEDKLGKGYAVMASIGGHLIRIQGIDDVYVTVDDPYGELDIERKIEGKNGYRCSTCDPKIDKRNNANSLGNNNKWKIEDAIKILKYYEYYYKK